MALPSESARGVRGERIRMPPDNGSPLMAIAAVVKFAESKFVFVDFNSYNFNKLFAASTLDFVDGTT